MISRLVLVAIGWGLLAAWSAEARAAVLAEETRPTGVSAFGGRVAWSHFDEAAGRYVLMTHANGITSRVPIPGRRSPFDADLGPDRDGTVAAVYSRCRREAAFYNEETPLRELQDPHGCDLHKYRFGDGRERRLERLSTGASSEALPTLWRDRIAFVRRSDRRPRAAFASPRLRVHHALQSGRGRARPLRAGPRDGGRAIGSLDLRGRRLASSWSYFESDFACGDERATEYDKIEPIVTEVWLDTLGERSRRIDTGCEGATPGATLGPGLVAGALLHTRLGSPSRPGVFLRRTPLDGGRPFDIPLDDADGTISAYDGDTMYGLDRVGDGGAATTYRITARPDPTRR